VVFVVFLPTFGTEDNVAPSRIRHAVEFSRRKYAGTLGNFTNNRTDLQSVKNELVKVDILAGIIFQNLSFKC
jgi:hypothetical protein